MNWINLLYPRPHFDVNYGPILWRKVHGTALIIAYYAAHTVALIGLSLIYGIVIIPLKIASQLRKEDLLEMKPLHSQKSYLKKPEDLAKMDFRRMF